MKMTLVVAAAISIFPSYIPSPAQDSVVTIGPSVKVCQVTGETDLEFNQPTASQTETRYGLQAADHGYSFEHNGNVFFLFGDTFPTPTFNGQNNDWQDLQAHPPYISPYRIRNANDPLSANDAVGYVRADGLVPCPKLNFTTNPIGAYADPRVTTQGGQPPVTLRINESPISGISEGGRMFVVFGTDNYVYFPPNTGPVLGNLGYPTRSVVGVSDDNGNTFQYLYDLSKGPCVACDGSKFLNTAMADAGNGYVYFWGTAGGTQFRQSAVYFARKPASMLASAQGMEYFQTTDTLGNAAFSPMESQAQALFTDVDGPSLTPAPCMGELGVEWNAYIRRWVMLYNCLDQTTANLPGIYMRVAPQPWGPWSLPVTIFNRVRDNGLCVFIHQAVPPPAGQTPCNDNLSFPAGRTAQGGGNYGPYFIPRLTTGDGGQATSTFYWTMDTFNPYTQVVMKTTIQREPGPH